MSAKTDTDEGTGKPARLERRDVLAALGAIGPLLLLACSSSSTTDAEGVDAAANDSGKRVDGARRDAAGEADAVSANDAGRDSGEREPTDSGADAGTASAPRDAGSCEEMPDETGGPYPDTNDMIASSKYNRSNITEGKTGTSLKLTLQLLDVSKGCAPIAGARVIIWHCDANGVYSEYASDMNSDPAQGEEGSTSTTYLRGWQQTDKDGNITFKTIYPGWYLPRVTHIHIMVYNPSDLTTPVKTTQFAFPDAANAAVYGQASLYPKGQNSTTNATDQVFGGGSDEGLVAAVAGSTSAGYVATLPVGIASY